MEDDIDCDRTVIVPLPVERRTKFAYVLHRDTKNGLQTTPNELVDMYIKFTVIVNYDEDDLEDSYSYQLLDVKLFYLEQLESSDLESKDFINKK